MFTWAHSESLKREFEDKVLRHIDSLYNVALRMTRNRQDAEDLVQEATFRAYRSFHKFQRGTNFRAWITTILRNTYINQYRKNAKEPKMVVFEDVENFISLPDFSGAQEEIFSEKINSSIENLPEELRTAITLFYVEEFSYKEIAMVMDCPIGTVMSRLYTARQILKNQLSVYRKDNT